MHISPRERERACSVCVQDMNLLRIYVMSAREKDQTDIVYIRASWIAGDLYNVYNSVLSERKRERERYGCLCEGGFSVRHCARGEIYTIHIYIYYIHI